MKPEMTNRRTICPEAHFGRYHHPVVLKKSEIEAFANYCLPEVTAFHVLMTYRYSYDSDESKWQPAV